MENNLELLPLTDDYIFKRVFAYKGNGCVYSCKIRRGLCWQRKKIKK